MDHSYHMAATTTTITELDLSACHPSSIVDKINAVPGLKTSAAFFTFLRANLVLPHSAMSSNVSTPYLEPQQPMGASPLPPSKSSPLAPQKSSSSNPTSPTDTLSLDDDIPPLSLEVLTTQPEKVDALRLITDSIAQQRQLASYSLVLHPLLLSLLIGALGLVYQFAWASRQPDPDLGTTLTLVSGTVMTYLLAIRWVVSPYIAHAESLKYDFLQNPETGEDDVIIGTKWGKDLIGATVLRLEASGASSPSSKKRSKSGSNHLKGGKGVIRAWTTKLRYRGRGVGGDMLAEAVRITREKCGRDAQVGFAKEHANSFMVLPEFFNGKFRKGERRAALALEKVAQGSAASGRKR